MGKRLNSVKNTLPKRVKQALKKTINRLKCLASSQNILVLAATLGLLFRGLMVFEPIKQAEAELSPGEPQQISDGIEASLVLVQENSLLALSSPKPQVVRTIKVIITGYSSSVWETDDTPYLTAACTMTRKGVVANNMLAFGTKIRIPELYGSQIFVVEDRMRWDRSNYQIDIWFPTHQEAKEFGAKITYIEVLGS
jgi:3D (Asp-Asp-Asp) domain-containing protein